MNKKEQFFRKVSVGACIFGLPQVFLALQLYQQCTKERPEFHWPVRDFTEFWISGVSACVIFGSKQLTMKLTPGLFTSIVKDQHDEKLKNVRVAKVAENFFQIVFYTVMSIYGYIVLKDGPWLPWYLGGKGHFDNTYRPLPWTEVQPQAITYALVSFGYRVGGILEVSIQNRPEKWELTLHHIISFLLVLVMLLTNNLGFTIVVFLHDLSELPLKVSKLFSCTIYENATTVSVIVMLGAWIWCRNLCFGVIVFSLAAGVIETGGIPNGDKYPAGSTLMWLNVILLGSLCIFHVYWLSLMIRITFNKILYNKSEDTHSDVILQHTLKEKAQKIN